MRLSIIATAAALGLAGLVGPSPSQHLQAQEIPQGIQTAAAEETNPAVVVLGSWQAESILGKEVRSKAGENLGRLIDVVVDRTGRPRAAVLDFGGFLGVGSRKIAIDWSALGFESDEGDHDAVTVDLTREQLKDAPEYKDKRAVLMLSSVAPASPDD